MKKPANLHGKYSAWCDFLFCISKTKYPRISSHISWNGEVAIPNLLWTTSFQWLTKILFKVCPWEILYCDIHGWIVSYCIPTFDCISLEDITQSQWVVIYALLAAVDQGSIWRLISRVWMVTKLRWLSSCNNCLCLVGSAQFNTSIIKATHFDFVICCTFLCSYIGAYALQNLIVLSCKNNWKGGIMSSIVPIN